MTARDLRARLKGARGAEDKYTACCPAHQDRQPSLSVREADDGRLLLKCFTGCTIEAIVGALGLTVTDLFPPKATALPLPRPLTIAALAADKGLPEAFLRERFHLLEKNGGGVEIPYRDAEGQTVALKTRTALAAKAGSRWPKGQPLMPYYLEGLEAARAAGYVVLVEGESDTWTLAYHGVPVLSLPGATATACLEREHLAGVSTVYLSHEGDAAAETFVAKLSDRVRSFGEAVTVRVLTMPEGCKDPNDLFRRDPAGFTGAFQARLDAAVLVGAESRNGHGASGTPEEMVTKVTELPSGAAGDGAGDGSVTLVTTSWGSLVPLEAPDAPPLPLDALPAVLADHVREVAATHQVPADLVALLALGSVAVACAGRAEVQIGQTHLEPLNLYVAAVAEPGERKAQALRETLGPLERWERRRRDLAGPAYATAKRARAIAEARLKHLTETAAKAREAEERQAALAEARAVEQAMPPVPVLPRLIVGNITMERLEMELADQGGVLALASEEAGDLFAIAAGRYVKDGGRSLDVLLKGYDGGRIQSDRVTRAGVDVERPALSLLLTPQPAILRGFADVPDFRGRGLLARPVYVVPRSQVGARVYQDRPRQVDAREAYTAALERLLGLPQRSAPDGAPTLTIARGKALDAWKRYDATLEADQAPGGRLAPIADWASKHAGRIARLAGLFHLLETPGADPWRVPIAPAVVDAAGQVGLALVEHALVAFALMGGEAPELAAARKYLAWIVRHGKAAFTLRDLHQHHRNVPEPEALLGGLRVLEKRGYLRAKPSPSPRPANRPASPAWDVNPAVHGEDVTKVTEPPVTIGESGHGPAFVTSVTTSPESAAPAAPDDAPEPGSFDGPVPCPPPGYDPADPEPPKKDDLGTWGAWRGRCEARERAALEGRS